ncbi:MAG: long-chain-acyl-CoA synthetase, partial [Pseudomonadales bacterium]|nr:long-chain-acyl-CoA synthetase [Pseudomonadales bacterium]
LFMENRPEYIYYISAIAKLGAITSLLNNSQSGQVLLHGVTLVKPAMAIVGEELIDTFNVIRDETKLENNLYFVPDKATLDDPSGEQDGYINIAFASKDCSASKLHVDCTDQIDDPYVYLYTSGTTGLPKATIQLNSKIINGFGLIMMLNGLKESDVVYSSLPLYHGTALGACFIATMASGASLAITRKFSVSNFWNEIEKHNATAFGYVGELCRYLLSQPESEAERKHNVRLVMGNGLKADLWMEFKNRFGIPEIREFYGSSEGNVASMNLFNLDKTVGLILTSFAVIDFDTELEEPVLSQSGNITKVPQGQAGLLLGKVTAITAFDGYTETDKNEGKLLRDVFKKGDCWFNTGDVVREIGCRHIQFVDRTGDTYRWKGENVSTSQIEKVSNEFPQVEESIAYGVEIPQTNGRAGMIAITLKDKNANLDEKAFYQYMMEQLPPYAVPLFVRVNDNLEKTATFKYQKVGLKKEGFDLTKVQVPVRVALPGNSTYVELTEDIHTKIRANEYRF